MVTLAVTGSSHRRIAAERATVEVVVRVEGADRPEVVAAAEALHARVSEQAGRHVESGVATRWSADQLVVRTEERWLEAGRVERVQVALAAVSVRFSDFRVMSSWLSALSQLEGVQLPGIAWDVPDARRSEVEREVRGAAVRDALARADEYAALVGAAGASLLALTEPGRRMPDRQVGAVATFKLQGAEDPGFLLRPEWIDVHAAVDADFLLD